MVVEKIWKIEPGVSSEFRNQFPEINPVILQLLYNRGLTDQKLIDEFLNPDYGQDLHDPSLLKDMASTVGRIVRAADKREKIAIFGDYDVDGITASVILAETFKKLGISGLVYIPDRKKEGYGLNKKAIKWLQAKHINLIITVDCGISNIDEVNYAKELGMEVIITDHHHCPDVLPQAFSIINPRQKDDGYPFEELTAAGIVFKLVQALETSSNTELEPGFGKKFLDLVALGTVADVAKILGENRTLVRYGLEVLGKSERLGIQKLIQVSRIRPENLATYAIGYQLGPRLNAAGRMDHANQAYYLLTTKLESEAESLAKKLDAMNRQRQVQVEKIIKQAKERIGEIDENEKIIIEKDKFWSIGICGLLAGKLKDEFARPVIASEEGEKEIRGSARSTPLFNIIEAIEKCQDILVDCGGHSQAAGFVVKKENYKELKERLEKIADEKLKPGDLKDILEIDMEINPENVDWDLFSELEKFKPFGESNPHPRFLLKNLEIIETRPVGNNNKHLKMKLGSDKKYWSAIGFDLGELSQTLRIGGRIDVVCTVDIDEWNGARELQLNLLDVKKKS